MKHTKYEKARMIGSRALQIAMGAPFIINLTKSDLKKINYNPIEIAKMEYERDIIPISIKRSYPEKGEEFDLIETNILLDDDNELLAV